MKTVDVGNLAQVGGRLRAWGYESTADLKPRYPVLHNPFETPRDGTAAEVVRKYKRRLLEACTLGRHPEVASALRGLCERVLDAERESAEDQEPSEPVLGYVGPENAAAAEAVARCVEWLLETGAWSDLPR